MFLLVFHVTEMHEIGSRNVYSWVATLSLDCSNVMFSFKIFINITSDSWIKHYWPVFYYFVWSVSHLSPTIRRVRAGHVGAHTSWRPHRLLRLTCLSEWLWSHLANLNRKCMWIKDSIFTKCLTECDIDPFLNLHFKTINIQD